MSLFFGNFSLLLSGLHVLLVACGAECRGSGVFFVHLTGARGFWGLSREVALWLLELSAASNTRAGSGLWVCVVVCGCCGCLFVEGLTWGAAVVCGGGERRSWGMLGLGRVAWGWSGACLCGEIVGAGGE